MVERIIRCLERSSECSGTSTIAARLRVTPTSESNRNISPPLTIIYNMSSIGPELPPHLVARRKRHAEEERGEGEAASPTSGRSSSPDGAKRQRVVGPSLPPAPLDERPNTISASHGDSNSEGDDDDDDGYGPAPPPPNGSVVRPPLLLDQTSLSFCACQHDAGSTLPPPTSEPVPVSTQPSKAQPERDAWMMMPPKQDDLAARMDPLKIRARKFNTGKGPHRAAPGSGNSDSTLWTETPEQKRKRLEDEVLGVTAPKTAEPAAAQVTGRTSKEERETARLIKEHAVSVTGPSINRCYTV